MKILSYAMTKHFIPVQNGIYSNHNTTLFIKRNAEPPTRVISFSLSTNNIRWKLSVLSYGSLIFIECIVTNRYTFILVFACILQRYFKIDFTTSSKNLAENKMF